MCPSLVDTDAPLSIHPSIQLRAEKVIQDGCRRAVVWYHNDQSSVAVPCRGVINRLPDGGVDPHTEAQVDSDLSPSLPYTKVDNKTRHRVTSYIVGFLTVQRH